VTEKEYLSSRSSQAAAKERSLRRRYPSKLCAALSALFHGSVPKAVIRAPFRASIVTTVLGRSYAASHEQTLAEELFGR